MSATIPSPQSLQSILSSDMTVLRASAGICRAPQAVKAKSRTAVTEENNVRDMLTHTMPPGTVEGKDDFDELNRGTIRALGVPLPREPNLDPHFRRRSCHSCSSVRRASCAIGWTFVVFARVCDTRRTLGQILDHWLSCAERTRVSAGRTSARDAR